MKRSWIISIILLTGCASSPQPNFAAMTPQQMAMYQQIQAQKQASDDQFYANLSAGNQALAGARYPTMATPQVTPLARPGGNQIRCIGVGIYANCRTY